MSSKSANDKLDKPLPLWIIALIPIYISLIMIFLIFPFAQDWIWLEAWVFIASLVFNLSISYYLINKKNPQVIRNRMKLKKRGITDKTKKAASSDKIILPFLGIGFIGAFMLPAFDYRFNWTTVPFPLNILGLVIMNIGLIITDVAMVQNAHASKILDINKDQKLIDSGLYGRVRHPLYSGVIIMILGVPIALDSWISLIPAGIAVLSLIIRIKFEEEMLIQGMEGYEDYRNRVKYKLFPKIF